MEGRRLRIKLPQGYEQQEPTRTKIIAKKLSVRQTESLVKNIKSGNKKSTRSSDVSRIYIDVTNKFETFFNSKITIKENSSGKISLSAIFDDINKLYEILKKISN